MVTHAEYAIEHKDIALGAFLDIEGAFDRPSFDIIKQAAERHGFEPAICRWFCAMLYSRKVNATLSRETLKTSAARGCPQRGVLSPLLAWLWTNCCGNSTVMATTQQDKLMI
jgi:hypothetical protein